MDLHVPKPDELILTRESIRKLRELLCGDDLDFYENYTILLSDEEQRTFFLNNPEFMEDFGVGPDDIEKLKEKEYRDWLRKNKKI